jgi:hypothetical protein
MQCAVRFFSFSAREGQTVAANGQPNGKGGADVAKTWKSGTVPEVIVQAWCDTERLIELGWAN